MRSVPENTREPAGFSVKTALGHLLPPQDYSAPASYRPPATWYRRLNRLGVPLTSQGLAPRDAVTLEVRGRRSGALRRTPVLVTEHEGASYLVALAGESDWVRNVRAAGGSAILRRRGVRPCRLVEVPVADRAPILAAYVAAGRRRSGDTGGRIAAQHNFGYAEPSLETLAALADRYPVFRVMDRTLPGQPVGARGAQRDRAGTFGNGMPYVTWGDGDRPMLFLPGGPGSIMPTSTSLALYRLRFAPYVRAGYQPWIVGRRHSMPVGHTMADMADDYANLIEEEFGGQVDLVVGESYGGCVAQYLAARHPERVSRLALVVAASRVSDAGLHFDRRLAEASAAGDAQGAVEAFADYLFGAGRLSWLRPALRWMIGNELARSSACPADDIRVELAAEESFDSRSALKEITAPVLMICGDRDMFFSRQVVKETAALIPNCTLVWYRGRGHLRTAVSLRVARDIVAFATSARCQRLAR